MANCSSSPAVTFDSASLYYHQPHYQPLDHHNPRLHHFHHDIESGPFHLPQCQALGCTNPVHCDYSLPKHLQTFNYCSPQCRDNHLLPTERTALETVLEPYKMELQSVSESVGSSVSKSQEGSSSNAGRIKSLLSPFKGDIEMLC